MNSPIVLFVYNRPDHTLQTIQALSRNYLAEASTIIIYSDGAKHEGHAKDVDEVRKVIRNIKRSFKEVSIIEQSENNGLAKSVINGVSEVMEQYGQAIVIEDDLISSPYMLSYMNMALKTYKDRTDIMSISAYNHSPATMDVPKGYGRDIYLSYRPSSWGWASWKEAWEKADWEMKDYDTFIQDAQQRALFTRGGDDMLEMLESQMAGNIDSWAIRWCYAHYKQDGYAVYPIQSYVNNIGFDGTGVHCNDNGLPTSELSFAKSNPILPKDIAADERLIKAFQKVYAFSTKRKIKNQVKRLIGFK